MDSGTKRYIMDANVRRLQELQEAATETFTAHVTRHKSDIAARHSYFQEKFPLLQKTVLEDRQPPSSPDEKAVAPENKGEDDRHGPSVAAYPQGSTDMVPPEEQAAPPADPDPVATRRAQWSARRQLRKQRRQRLATRNAPTTVSVQPKEASPDTMTNPPTRPTMQQQETSISAEEIKVLMEIEKFEKMIGQLKAAPNPAPTPPQEPTESPVTAISAKPAKTKLREPGGLSFRNLFDLSPRFRTIDAEDDDN
jgi:hypothetical protein